MIRSRESLSKLRPDGRPDEGRRGLRARDLPALEGHPVRVRRLGEGRPQVRELVVDGSERFPEVPPRPFDGGDHGTRVPKVDR